MHPAPSIILFTTLSGLGFGLLFWLGLDPDPPRGWVAFVFFALGYALAVGGLLASTRHLGRPERALKAFTQWRSSWLSREAWASVATLLVMAVYGGGLVFLDSHWQALGVVGAALALSTVYTTSMIYAQLRTVPRWFHWSTSALFLAYAVTGGAILAAQIIPAVILSFALGGLQIWWWKKGDDRLKQSGTDLASATGLGPLGKVRAFEPPHTGTNYLLREFVYVVGRKHGDKLRTLSMALVVALPAPVLLLLPGHLWAGLAVLSHLGGVLMARWLFFAEAEHVVGFYYGKRG